MSDVPMSKEAARIGAVKRFLEHHTCIMNVDVRSMCDVSPATANRILAGLAAEGMLEKYREGSHWAYRLK